MMKRKALKSLYLKVMRSNMKAIVKIIFSVCLIVSLFASFISCDRKYDEAEVIAAANTLIRKSAVIEDILYGEGFSVLSDEGENEQTNGYQRVNPESIAYYASQMGETFTDIAGLKSVISKVYTAGYANDIFSGVLTGSSSSYTRYFQDGEYIMSSSSYVKRKTDTIVYDYNTLRVTDVDGEKITVSVDIVIINSQGQTQSKSIEIDMLEEASGWKLDTPTFAVYNANQDRYNQLENELNKK